MKAKKAKPRYTQDELMEWAERNMTKYQSEFKLKKSEKVIYGKMLVNSTFGEALDNYGWFHTPYTALASDCQLTEETVNKAIHTLADIGLIEIDKSDRCNAYKVVDLNTLKNTQVQQPAVEQNLSDNLSEKLSSIDLRLNELETNTSITQIEELKLELSKLKENWSSLLLKINEIQDFLKESLSNSNSYSNDSLTNNKLLSDNDISPLKGNITLSDKTIGESNNATTITQVCQSKVRLDRKLLKEMFYISNDSDERYKYDKWMSEWLKYVRSGSIAYDNFLDCVFSQGGQRYLYTYITELKQNDRKQYNGRKDLFRKYYNKYFNL